MFWIGLYVGGLVYHATLSDWTENRVGCLLGCLIWPAFILKVIRGDYR